MKTDKEYPATHSMSTAWYMVDTDGNVGLMAFDDNGPVPDFEHVQPELGLSDLVFGQGFSADDTCGGIHLNEAQLHELLGAPRRPDDVEQWFDVCLAVAPERTAEFLSLCNDKNIMNCGCVSPEMNLFLVYVANCVDYENDCIIEGSPLDRMIKGGMIRAVYQLPELDVSSEYDRSTESVVFTKEFDNAPFYVYCQSYWTSDLQHRMNVPTHPVGIGQIDEAYRKKMLHVPVRFKDAEDLQIAQWFVCKSNAHEVAIGNAGYSLFPIDKHTGRYFLTSPFRFDFYEYCPEKDRYKCDKCTYSCATLVRVINSLTPTTLYVASPARKIDIEQLDLPQKIKDRIVAVSYIPKFPHKVSVYDWLSEDRLKSLMTTDVLTALLSSSRDWFENVVRIVNPQVIIIDDEALPVFAAVFPIADNELRINNQNYPIFKESSVGEDEDGVISLSEKPYRGKIFRMSYSEHEVDALMREGKALEAE